MPKVLWSPAQARQFAHAGAHARWHSPRRPPASSAILALNAEPAAFPDTLLARVRAQVSGLCTLIDEETVKRKPDAQRLDRLAAALERLAELERRLDGRPLPGSRRPARDDAPIRARPRSQDLPEPTVAGEDLEPPPDER